MISTQRILLSMCLFIACQAKGWPHAFDEPVFTVVSFGGSRQENVDIVKDIDLQDFGAVQVTRNEEALAFNAQRTDFHMTKISSSVNDDTVEAKKCLKSGAITASRTLVTERGNHHVHVYTAAAAQQLFERLQVRAAQIVKECAEQNNRE
jgi:hypothetical protein